MDPQGPEDLERRIAESLRNRAGDVTPSPELWTRVEATVNTNRRTWAYVLAGAALTIAAAAVVVPQFIQDDTVVVGNEDPTDVPTASEDPTTHPNPSETPTDGTTARAVVLATDGEDIFLLAETGGARTMLIDQPPLGENNEVTILSLAVRPGSTRDHIDAVVMRTGEGLFDFHHLVAERQGSSWVASMTPFPDRYQPWDIPLASDPRPVFSPDGRHLAWVEMPNDEQAPGPTLRTIGWTDAGPGTGNTADDNASFTLDELALQPYRVEDWTWERDATETPGHLVLRAAGPIETVLVPIARQADGALTLPTGGTTLLDGAVVDRAEVEGPVVVIHELIVGGDGSQDAEGVSWRILSQFEDGPVETLVPLGPTADPGQGWMDANQDLVLAGHGGEAVIINLVTRSAINIEMTFGALVPAG